MAPGGWVDKTMNIGTKGMFNLIARGVRFSLHSFVAYKKHLSLQNSKIDEL